VSKSHAGSEDVHLALVHMFSCTAHAWCDVGDAMKSESTIVATIDAWRRLEALNQDSAPSNSQSAPALASPCTVCVHRRHGSGGKMVRLRSHLGCKQRQHLQDSLNRSKMKRLRCWCPHALAFQCDFSMIVTSLTLQAGWRLSSTSSKEAESAAKRHSGCL